MRKLFTKTLLFVASIALPACAFATSYVSAGAGPLDWNSSSSWLPAGIPNSNDDVTINAGHTIFISVDNNNVRHLVVNGTLNFTALKTLYIFGNYTVNGSQTGPAYIGFKSNAGSLISGPGSFSTTSRYTFFLGGNRTISAGTTIVTTANLFINGATITNQGNFTVGVMTSSVGSVFINDVGSTLSITQAGFMAGRTFTANAANNTVNIRYASGALPLTSSGFYNLTLAGTGSGAKTLPAATVVANNLTINTVNTLAANGFDLTVSGNWSNSGAFTPGTNSVTFNGTGAQSVTGTATTTFFNWILNGTGTTTLLRNAAVTNLLTINSGVLDASTFAVTGAAGLTMAGGEYRTAKLATPEPELTGTYTLNGGAVTYNGAGAQTIRSGVTFFNLNISGTGTKTPAAALAIKGNLTINSTLDVTASNFGIDLKGNWVNNGVFTQRLGTVTLSGTSAQTLSGTASTTFENLTLNNTSGATITASSYQLDGALTLSNGTFNTGGRPFTMTSTASKTARIAPISGTGAVAGNFTIQRFISSRDTTWADLSSTVQAATFNDWDNELPAIFYGYAPPSQYPTQYTYSEPLDDFVPVTSAATALTPGKGFEVFLAGDFSYSNLPNTVIDLVGVPNQGNQNLSGLISFAGAGSNLVGNPFASSISWTSVFSASSRLLSSYDTYDFTTGNYSTHGLGTEIGSGQGFWVYATGASPTLVINENAKTTSSNSSLRSTIEEPYFTLKLSGNDPANKYSHLLKIAADNASSDGWDENDHPYHKSPNKLAPSIVSPIADGKQLVINTFSASNITYSMPLETKVGIAGYYKLEAAGFDNISNYNCIKLEDKLLNKIVTLKEGVPYSFQMNPGDDANRFVVHFGNDCGTQNPIAVQKSLTDDFSNQVMILPTNSGNLVTFNLSEATETIISVTNLLGQSITEPVQLTAETQSVNVTIPQDFSGMYLVKVESAKGSTIKKFVRK